MKRRNLGQTILTYLSLLLYFSFFLLPILWIVLSSVLNSEVLFSSRVIPGWNDFTLQHYFGMLGNRPFFHCFINTSIIALGVTVVTLVLSSLAAYALSKYEMRGKKSMIVGILLAQMFPFVLIIISLYILMSTFNLVDTYLGIILAHLILSLPFCTWMLKGYFDSIPKELIESARLDGCSKLRALWKIVLPLSAPGLAVASFYAFVVSWGDYLFVSVLNQTSHTTTLSLLLQRITVGLQVKWGQISAATVLIILPVVLLFALVQRWLVEGLLAGATKG